MDQILTDNVWKQVAPYARSCRRRLAALAYVSIDTHIRFKRGDMLVCDASDASIKAGETSAAVLSKWHKAGVRIYSRPGLHAKVLVMGTKALVGSANLSQASASRLREASLLTSRAVLVSQAKAFVHFAKSEATEVDDDFLTHARSLKVTRKKSQGPPKRRKQKKLGSRLWIVRVHEIESDRYANEEEYVDRAAEKLRRITGDDTIEPVWIRWTGHSRFRREARAGDTVVELWSAHKGKRIAVQPPSAILLRQDTQKWTRFYCDPTVDRCEVSWTEFQRHLRRLGVGRITRNSVRQLSKRDAALIQTIWDE
jgi:hypothetical protein